MAEGGAPNVGEGAETGAATSAAGAADGVASGGRTTARAAEQQARHPTEPATPHSAGTAPQHPAAVLYGQGHVVVHGNAPFRALFGSDGLGLPAAEALLDLPRSAFELMDLVYRGGRPLARWITMRGGQWRLTIAERRDIGTGEVYGIALHLVPRDLGDVPG